MKSLPLRNGTVVRLVISQPSKLSTNYFAVGGYAATFLNIGLVGLISLALFGIFRATPNNVSNLAFLLTLGFSAWGRCVCAHKPLSAWRAASLHLAYTWWQGNQAK